MGPLSGGLQLPMEISLTGQVAPGAWATYFEEAADDLIHLLIAVAVIDLVVRAGPEPVAAAIAD